ncbi:hypothetical protein AA0313_2575 [Acetobacter indonesiensis NRIC 0313]|nr:hypothetical protein AA0313_2575 [Acetobacter indonesiensis NRIC 0313]
MLVVFEVLSYVAFVTLPDPGISIVDPVFPKPEILLKVKIVIPLAGVITKVPPPSPKVIVEPPNALISDVESVPRFMVPPFSIL